MRAPIDTRDSKTTHFLASVAELETYANLHRFEGAGSFYAWERLNALISQLRGHYDIFELEGDAAPVRREVERYQADLGRLKVKPDPWVVGHLTALMDCLEDDTPDFAILTSVIPVAPSGNTPKGYLAVTPEALEALLKQRSEPPSLPPGA